MLSYSIQIIHAKNQQQLKSHPSGDDTVGFAPSLNKVTGNSDLGNCKSLPAIAHHSERERENISEPGNSRYGACPPLLTQWEVTFSVSV